MSKQLTDTEREQLLKFIESKASTKEEAREMRNNILNEDGTINKIYVSEMALNEAFHDDLLRQIFDMYFAMDQANPRMHDIIPRVRPSPTRPGFFIIDDPDVPANF